MSLIIQEFFSVVEKYNSAVFPLQLVFFVIGIAAVYWLFLHKLEKNLLIGGLLTLLWLWMVTVYHILFFNTSQPLAYIFGILFVGQGVFFFLETFNTKNLVFSIQKNIKSYLALFFIFYGLIIYPIVNLIPGGSYVEILSVGLPAPTIILTFGFLMLTDKRFSRYLLIIPTVWAVTGTGAALYFGAYQDVLLIIAAITANVYLLPKRRYNESKTFSYF